MTNPVGSGPLLQHGDHPPAANDARVAKPAGVSPGHSQEITNSHLKRQSAANDAPIETRIRVLQTKLHIPDFHQGPTFDTAVDKLGRKLVQAKGHEPISDRMIDDRIAQLESQRATHNDSFAGRKIRSRHRTADRPKRAARAHKDKKRSVRKKPKPFCQNGGPKT